MPHRLEAHACRDYGFSSRLEWMLANGIGGYAMGTASGANTRRYHGHLVAAVGSPTARQVLVAGIEAYLTVNGQSFGISTNQYVGAVHPQGYLLLDGFRAGRTVEWTLRAKSAAIVKRLSLHAGANGCTVEYQNLSEQQVGLTLRPLVCHKPYHSNFRLTDFYPQFLVFHDERTVLSHDDVKLTIEHPFADRTPTTGWYYRFEHPRESERGLDPIDDLYCPCELRYVLSPGETARLTAFEGEHAGEPIAEVAPEPDDVRSMLVAAAEPFLVKGPDRTTLVAGYPWFTDWGRDTMISIPGLCLSTGKYDAARSILRSFALRMHQGLVPNRFIDADDTPEYHTADATLWFVNALHATLQAEWDGAFALEAFDWIQEVVAWHVRGTLFGIGIDPADNLLRQGAPGYQLTWMDAKVGDWVVTPRHGKPVEVNGLWINALRIAAWLAERTGKDPGNYTSLADSASSAFEKKFWKPSQRTYLDTVEPDDASLRPNQVLAMGLPFSPVDPANARIALARVREELLTPNGLRTLSPLDSAYRGHYVGSLPERDAAYHQGTVWPWLIGSYVAAVLRYESGVDECRAVLSRVPVWLTEYGMGGIAEVYDGDPPQYPGGCPWQAWSVAEILRAWDLVGSVQPD